MINFIYVCEMKWTAALFLLLSFASWSQSKIFIKDDISKEPIPFAKVFPNIGEPFLADLDGAFVLNNDVDSITLKSAGFPDTTVIVDDIQEQTIWWESKVQLIQEMVVRPGVNPAHRIMQQAIDNRKKNHPLENDAFTYKSYSKFVFDMNKEGLAAIPEDTNDSTLIEIRKFFQEQHLFLMESVSERKFVPPYRDNEEIIAYKVSGFKDPRLSTFANSMQSFSFYDNQFDLLGKHYINPIARGGIRRYLFILEDTTVVNQDTTFTIFYRPRKGKDFDGLTGRLFINTNGFAVEKVIAEPYQDSTGLDLKIVQEYEFLDGKKWFPSKLSTNIAFTAMQFGGVPNSYVEGKGNTYIDSVVLNPEGLKVKNNNIVLSTSEDAAELDSSSWSGLRKYEITDREARTYTTIDSLSKANNLEAKLKALSVLMTGKIPIGKFNTDLERLLDFNQHEGYRLGLGLETSDRLIKWMSVGGYFAYGFRDKAWKYGGDLQFNLSRKNGMYLKFSYTDDVAERGGRNFDKVGFDLNNADLYSDFFIDQMDRERKLMATLGTDIRSNMKLRLIGGYSRIYALDNYRYTVGTADSLSINQSFDLAEIGTEIIWNIGAKYMLLGNQKVMTENKYPQIRLKVMQGISGIEESQFDYTRIYADVSQTNVFRGVGTLKWRISAAYLTGDAPIQRAFNSNGTGKDWNLAVENTFETMPFGSFFSTQEVAVFTRFYLNPFSTKADWNEPQLGVHLAAGYSDFSNRNFHDLDFQTMEKGYQEAGLILNGLLTSGFSAIGVGGFYHFGTYSNPTWYQNIVPKISISFNL